MNRNYSFITFISKYFYFKGSEVAILVILLASFKHSTFKDSTRIRKNILKYNFYLYFLIKISGKMLISAELKGCGGVLRV